MPKKAAATLLEAVEKLEADLKAAGIRVKVDSSEGKSTGWKFNYWEMKASCSFST